MPWQRLRACVKPVMRFQAQRTLIVRKSLLSPRCRDILFGVLQHHERCDGSGYPYGVCRAQISDFGRVMAILDIYDAMTADRSYAKKKSPFDIFAILHDDIMSGKLDTEYGVYFTKLKLRRC